MEKLFSKSTTKNKEVAEKVLTLVNQRQTNKIFLYGNLGSGKTSLTKQIGKLLNVKQIINSPTFIIKKNYTTGKNIYGFKTIAHYDLYRLSSKEEALDIGIEEDLNDNNCLVIVEWPKILNSNQKAVKVKIKHINKGRIFKIY